MAWMQRRKRDVQQVVNEDERITATGLFNVRLLEIVQSQKCDLVTQKLQTVTTFSLGDLVTKNVEKALKIKACASLCSTCNFQASQDERAGDAFNVLPIGRSYKLPPVFRLSWADVAHLTVCCPPYLYVLTHLPHLPEAHPYMFLAVLPSTSFSQLTHLPETQLLSVPIFLSWFAS